MLFIYLACTDELAWSLPVYTVKFCSITSAFADKIAQSIVQSPPSVILIIVV